MKWHSKHYLKTESALMKWHSKHYLKTESAFNEMAFKTIFKNRKCFYLTKLLSIFNKYFSVKMAIYIITLINYLNFPRI